MKKNIFLKIMSIGLLPGLLFLNSCTSENNEARNMEQIYEDEGVPIKIEKVVSVNFESSLTYNTILSGIKESSANAMVDGRIEKVFVKAGDFVKKDQMLVAFPTDNPSAQYFQAEAAYQNSLSTYERYKSIYEAGGVSKQTLDDIKTQMEVNKANFDNIQELVKVKAPISGYVTKVSVNESDVVKKEVSLVTVADLSKLKATINISESEINEVKVGTKATAKWQGQIIFGKVSQVDLAMNTSTQSFNANIEFDNKEGKFAAGLTVDVILSGAGGNNTISVERKNLVKKGDDYFVFVNENNTAIMKKVEIGKSRGLSVEILNGLDENEILITEGQIFLENKTKVKVIN